MAEGSPVRLLKWWGRAVRRTDALRARLQLFDFSDFARLLAGAIGFALVLSFCIFSTYDYFGSNPVVLKLAVVMLALLSSFGLFVHFRLRVPTEKAVLNPMSRKVTLSRLDEDDMPHRYSAALVWVFATGMCIAALGLALLTFGIAVSSFEIRFWGSAFLAGGCVLVTLSVIRGASSIRQSA